jgi:EmrB/QacA subfamily drug resistance transporter
MTNHKGLALAALCGAAFIINLDTTIVNVALPSLVRETGATTTDLQWVVDAYSLVFAALVLVAGSLGDRFGRRGMLLAGLGVFGVASGAGALCTGSHQLIAARAVMGLGAAMMFPSTLSLISNIFVERNERAKAIGLWGATAGIGIAMGPIFGGWLLEHFQWGSIFAFMVPIAALIGVLVALVVPTSRDKQTPTVDWRGFILSTAGMALLVLAVIEGPDWGWTSTSTLGCLAGGAALLGAFFVAERRTAYPMLDVGLFSNRRFTAASGSVTVSFFALSGFIFLITQYFQFVKLYSPFATGVRLLPVAGSVALASVLGTRYAVRIGNKVIVGAGLALFSAALFWVAASSAATPYPQIAIQMVMLGLGMGLTAAPATEAIMGVVPKEKAGVGSAVNDATRLFGATLGVAVIGSVAASLYSSKLAGTLPRGLPGRAVAAAHGSIGGATAATVKIHQAGLPVLAQRLHDVAVSAFMHSLAGGCIVAGGTAALGAVIAVLFLPSRPSSTSFPSGHEVSPPSALELDAPGALIGP